jgi:ParB family chromosome partitioning protein
LELLHDIGELGKRGYSESEIAAKTGLSYEYVRSIRHLIDRGEERLLTAVESGKIPISVAIEIAETDEEGAQEALAQAYQDGLLRGKKLLLAKRMVKHRQRHGKAVRHGAAAVVPTKMSSKMLVNTYEREADRQRLMIKKAEVAQNRLLFVVEAMRQLLADENFVTLLRAENMATMPRPLADLVAAQEAQ